MLSQKWETKSKLNNPKEYVSLDFLHHPLHQNHASMEEISEILTLNPAKDMAQIMLSLVLGK
jgi:hypothetical protein